jgi:putative GTP pyrophosphokinase
LTDLTGLRVVVVSKAAVERVNEAIRSLFEVDEANSCDKTSELGVDQIGYRSIHFVCKLGSSRTCLPEYSNYADFKFEIQVRTVLENIWADASHNAIYKLDGEVPPELIRRLNLSSAQFEMFDADITELTERLKGRKP